MTIKITLSLVFILNAFAGFAQNQLRNDIIPHSPEAEGFAKYVATPVTLYNGAANVTIPIYEIKSSKLSLPISINYNYSGYRPAEEATWIGLGWNLSAGGGITRIVKGLIDESVSLQSHYDDYVDINPMQNKELFLSDAALGFTDIQPDLYIFNFNGFSGKFIMLKGRPVMFPQQDLKIEETGSLGYEKFTITTQDGTIYTFDERETTYMGHTFTGDPWFPQHTSAWFLTKIQSADKTDEIDLHYNPYNYTPPPSFTDVYNVNSPIPGGGGTNINGHTYNTTAFSYPNILSKQLSYISSTAETVSFSTESTARLDMLDNTSKALQNINISNSTGLLRNINLVHSYFSGQTRGADRATKLVLKEVDINSTPVDANGDGLPPRTYSKYLMDYYSETTPFNIQTKAIDYDGYYNGADNNQSLFPAVGFISPALPVLGNRASNYASTVIGALYKLTYPTGGNAIFQYELNGLDGGTPGTVASGAGNNIFYTASLGNPNMNETPFTLSSNQTVAIRFGRTTSTANVLNNKNIFIISNQNGSVVYTSRLLSKTELAATASISLVAGNYYCQIFCESTSLSAYGYIDFTVPGVVQTLPRPGLRIKQISSYDNLNQTSPALTKNYGYIDDNGRSTGVTLAASTITSRNTIHHPSISDISSYNMDQTYTADVNSSLSGLLDVQYYYKAVTEINNNINESGKTVYEFNALSNDALGVYLSKQTNFKFDGTQFLPLKITQNNYDLINTTSKNVFRSDLYADGYTLLDLDNDDPFNRVKLYKSAGNYGLVSGYKLLNNTIETNYDQNGGNPLINQVNYFYDNPLHQFPTRKVQKNSKGEDLTTEMKYPLDYDFAGCGTTGPIETAFNTAVQNALNTYTACRSTRLNALTTPVDVHPFYPNTTVNQNSFLNIALNTYPCENNLKSNSATVFANRNAAYTTYNSCLASAYTSNANQAQKSVIWMQMNHIISPVIEQYSSIKKAGIDNLISAAKTDYKILPTAGGYFAAVPDVINQTELNFPMLKSTFTANPSSYYKQQAAFNFDNNISLTEQHKVINLAGQLKDKNIITSYLWDYNNLYPSAEVINATTTDIIAYTSFEADSKGGFTFTGSIAIDYTAPTGLKYYQLSPTSSITKTIDPAGVYTLSLWAKSAAGVTVNNLPPTVIGRSNGLWTYFEWQVSAQSAVTVASASSISIDEIRLYPTKAQMNTYTYAPGKGITTKCDINNITSYFEYDALGRLQLTRDLNRNILKRFCYNYAGQPIDCGTEPAKTYENNLLTKRYSKSCGLNYLPCSIWFTVPALMFTSLANQADADQQALNYADINGQIAADNPANCTCVAIVPVTVKCTNTSLQQNFTVAYTNVTTGQAYSFPISSLSGTKVLGSINSGVYNITITRPGYFYQPYDFTPGCGSLTFRELSATFSNITISAASCNTLTISFPVD